VAQIQSSPKFTGSEEARAYWESSVAEKGIE